MIRHCPIPFRRLTAVALFVASLAALPVAKAAEAPAVKPDAATAPNRVLFVGNSYLSFNDGLQNHVRRLAMAAMPPAKKDDPKKPRRPRFRSATISGGQLQDHPIESYLQVGRMRIDGGFEMVVLQGGSAAALSDAGKTKFTGTVVAFDKAIRARGARTALYMTPAYVHPHQLSRPDMIRAIEALYVETGNKVGALVIPVGLAFEEAHKQRPDIRLHKRFDGSHPNMNGTYLAACVVYASLYGKSPVGIRYDYFGAVDRRTAAFLQKVAETTVNRFFGITLPPATSR
jgi:hypothetical protein